MAIKEALLFVLRRALMKDQSAVQISLEEAKMLDAYFPEGFMTLTPEEFNAMKRNPRNFTKGVVVVKKTLTEQQINRIGGPELMRLVDIKYRVGVRSTK